MPASAVYRFIQRGLLPSSPTSRPPDGFWGLVFLEASLFFALSFWESGPPYAAPSFHPIAFAVVTLLAATAALFLCHLGPAFLASCLPPKPSPIGGLVLLWLAAGYLEWIPSLARTIAFPLSGSAPYETIHTGISAFLYPAAWLGATALLLCTGWARNLWKPISTISFGVGVIMLGWCVVSNWQGIGVLNSYFSGPPTQLDWLVWKRTILAATPAIAIAWRLGEVAGSRIRIWISGIAGLWLPAIISLAAASLAVEAGSNLHWRPSLFRGFHWALPGSGDRLTALVLGLCGLTLLAPALVCSYSIRLLADHPAWRWNRWLLPIAALPVIWGFASLLTMGGEVVRHEWDSPFHDFWTISVLVIGAAAGVAAQFNAKPPQPEPGTAEPTAAQYPAKTALLPPAESD